MEEKDLTQEFDLDEILNEFHDLPEEETVDAIVKTCRKHLLWRSPATPASCLHWKTRTLCRHLPSPMT